MAKYRLLIKPSAAKEIDTVDSKKDRQRIVSRIRGLATAPRPSGSEKLAGVEGRYRLRQGSYRIIYAVDDRAQVVEMVKVGHRREVYRNTT